MDPRTAERMTSHVKDLARAHGVRLRWCRRWRDAYAYPEAMTAIVPEIRHPHDYLFALHEIGHCVDPTAQRLRDDLDPHSLILCEGAAWAWAGEQAIPALARSMRAEHWAHVSRAWGSYLFNAARSPLPKSPRSGP